MDQVKRMGEIYCDYLYDCCQSNKILTDEDWMWYGRELHHMEIPNCKGGIHNPLNSQYLTTYQHWVAGVLQSEVLGHVCYGYVPKGVLPGWVETLRLKWSAESARISTGIREKKREPLNAYAKDIPYDKRTPNERSRKISEKLGNPVILTTPQGQIIRYDSIKLACRIHCLHPGHIREVCQGKRKQHKGYTARYA
jgi:hypothetical protein